MKTSITYTSYHPLRFMPQLILHLSNGVRMSIIWETRPDWMASGRWASHHKCNVVEVLAHHPSGPIKFWGREWDEPIARLTADDLAEYLDVLGALPVASGAVAVNKEREAEEESQ